VWTVLQVMQM